ncbi:unnamed protein product, partial [Aphanomyces euteiches]
MPAFVDNHVFHKGKGGKRVTYCSYCSQSMTSQSKARWEQHMRGCLQCPDDVKQQFQLKKRKHDVFEKSLSSNLFVPTIQQAQPDPFVALKANKDCQSTLPKWTDSMDP